jgi:hypothetical protein
MPRLLRLLPLFAALSALVAEPPKTAPQLAFVRSAETPEKQTALQTLSALYRPAHGTGPAIWLIGVAHLGTPEYYAALQKRLDAQSAVLFEGVGGTDLAHGAKPDTSAGIQGQMARALGLQFQRDAIDYQRKHFVNSDLTPEALSQAVARRAGQSSVVEPNAGRLPLPKAKDSSGEKSTPPVVDNATFNNLMDALRGEGELAEAMSGLIGVVGSSPEMRETTKVMLIEALGQAGELIEVAKAASPEMKDLLEVLITERNATVVQQLDEQVKKRGPDETIAVFYGAAHMDEIAARLTGQLAYRPAAEHWDTAFTADPAKSIFPPAQMKMLMEMMRGQLQNPGAASESNAFPLLNLFGQPPATPAAPPGK